MIALDFETEGIAGNVVTNPPVPVGLAAKVDGEKPVYFAWGHPEGNNSTKQEAANFLHKAWDKDLLFHNAGFDVSVAMKHFNLRMPSPQKIYDTQYSIFLTEPYARSMSLKPSAERILGLPPEEQDKVREWVMTHVQEARVKPSTWGAYICRAPGDLVAEYAKGDVDRTYGIHQKLFPVIQSMEMEQAYRREQRLFPILQESSARGIRVDIQKLYEDYAKAEKLMASVDDWFYRRLGCEFDIDKDAELADALERAGLVKEWILTATGRRSIARKNLVQVVEDKDLLVKLNYRSALGTAMNTFMLPWIEFAAEDGRVHTSWNQVRGDKSNRDMAGARTGRLSSMEPNFTNVMTESLWQPAGWPSLPYMRQYLLPEEDHVWLKRDWSAQEMRWAAEFSEGSLLEAFKANPETDPHNFVKERILEMMGKDLPRKHVKETGFQILYGGGARAISEKLQVSYEEGAGLKKTYFGAMPELKELSDTCNNTGKRGGFIRTWGGRVYYPEPPAVVNGRMQDFSYKLINYLMQGSSADQIKESTIQWNEVRHPEAQLQALVHDEVNISVPKDIWEKEMDKLRACMNNKIAEVPFLSEGFKGPNWHDLEEVK